MTEPTEPTSSDPPGFGESTSGCSSPCGRGPAELKPHRTDVAVVGSAVRPKGGQILPVTGESSATNIKSRPQGAFGRAQLRSFGRVTDIMAAGLASRPSESTNTQEAAHRSATWVRAGDSRALLAHEGANGAVRAPPHPCRAGTGHRQWNGERTTRATGCCRCSAPKHDVVEHRKALPHREVAAAIESVRGGPGQGGRAGIRVPGADGGA